MTAKFPTMIAICAILFSLLLSTPSSCEELRFAYDEFPPYSYSIGSTAQGVGVDLIREVCWKHDVTPVFVKLPFTRALLDAKTGAVDSIVAVTPSDERREFLTFPDKGAIDDSIVLYVTTASGLKLQSLDDISGQRVGAARGYYYGKGVLEKVGSNVVYVKDNSLLFNMLKEGRFNVVLSSTLSGNYYLDQLELRRKVKVGLVLNRHLYYFPFSKKLGERAQKLADMFGTEIEQILQRKRAVEAN